MNVITIILLIVVSTIVIAAEASLGDAVFAAGIVRRYGLLTAGVYVFVLTFITLIDSINNNFLLLLELDFGL